MHKLLRVPFAIIIVLSLIKCDTKTEDKKEKAVASLPEDLPEPVDTLEMKIDTVRHKMPVPKAARKYNQNDSLIYELVVNDYSTETWYTYNDKGLLTRSLKLNSYPTVEEISYTYDEAGRVIKIDRANSGLTLKREFFYSDTLVAFTSEMSGVMENEWKNLRFYYDTEKNLIAVDCSFSYDNWRTTSRRQLIEIDGAGNHTLIEISQRNPQTTNALKSKLFGEGNFSNDGASLEALDENGRLAVEYHFGSESTQVKTISYYPDGNKKSIYLHSEDIMGDNYDSLNLTAWGDTLRYYQQHWEEPVILKEFTYNDSQHPTKVIEQKPSGVEIKTMTYNETGDLLETRSYTIEFDDIKFTIAEKEIQELEEKFVDEPTTEESE